MEEMAVKASELLQENHERHHVFFNKSGFHVRFFITQVNIKQPSSWPSSSIILTF
jgi:hypothetical protein